VSPAKGRVKYSLSYEKDFGVAMRNVNTSWTEPQYLDLGGMSYYYPTLLDTRSPQLGELSGSVEAQVNIPTHEIPIYQLTYAYTVHHTPCTIHHAPCTIHHTPYTIHHTPYTIHHTPYTIHHTPYTIHHTPYTIHHTPYTIHHTTTHTPIHPPHYALALIHSHTHIHCRRRMVTPLRWYHTRPKARHAPAQSRQCAWQGQAPARATACTRRTLCRPGSVPSLTFSGSTLTTPFTETPMPGTSRTSVWRCGTPLRTHRHRKGLHHRLDGYWPRVTKGRCQRLRQWSESRVTSPQSPRCTFICGDQASCGGRCSSATQEGRGQGPSC
jgi:hypothetical protein